MCPSSAVEKLEQTRRADESIPYYDTMGLELNDQHHHLHIT